MAIDVLKYNDFDYNVKRQFKDILQRAAVKRFGTIQLNESQFHIVFLETQNALRDTVINFYMMLKVVNPDFTENDIKTYYEVNISKLK